MSCAVGQENGKHRLVSEEAFFINTSMMRLTLSNDANSTILVVECTVSQFTLACTWGGGWQPPPPGRFS